MKKKSNIINNKSETIASNPGTTARGAQKKRQEQGPFGFLDNQRKKQFIFPTQAAFLLEVSLFILNLDSTEHNINRTSSPSIKF